MESYGTIFSVKYSILILTLIVSYIQASEDSQYSYQELIEIQSVLLDSYSADSDQSVALSLSQVSYKVAENLMQSYIENNDPSVIRDAIDSLNISISIFPENQTFYLFKGDMYYQIRKYDAYYLEAMKAYEDSQNVILESKKSFVSLIDLYANQELYAEAFLLIRKMLFFDSQWLLDEFFDMTITLTSQTNNQEILLGDLSVLADQYNVEIPNIYLAKSYLSLSLNDYEIVKKSYAKYQAAKLFSENQNISSRGKTISNYLNTMAQLNE